MYCPKCGQQQISEEMRFCSRCGLALTGLAEWLVGGTLPAQAFNTTTVSSPSPRRKQMRRAGKLLFLGGVAFPVFLVIGLMIDEAAPMIFPVIMLFVAIVWMLYARLFLDNTSTLKTVVTEPSELRPVSTPSSLPPPSAGPMYGFDGRRIRTNELAQPRSVTENTTRLLDEE